MRLLSFALLFCFIFSSCGGDDKKVALSNNTGAAKFDSAALTSIEWLDSANRDFGKIPEGKKLDVSFRFRNSGDKPLIIKRVQPSCGCTVAEQPAEPIMPGKEGVIKASFNSENRVGPNHKTLYVLANTRQSQTSELHFQVEVEKKKW